MKLGVRDDDRLIGMMEDREGRREKGESEVMKGGNKMSESD